MAQDGDMEAGVRSLLEVNNLGYRMTPGMSVATSRVTREWNAMRNSYTQGDILSFPISSGAAYVDPDNSYITFDIVITVADPDYRFFWGSDTEGRQNSLNLYQDMRLTHSSGYEIDRITRGFGPWKYIQHAYTKDREWHDTFGSLLRGCQTTPGINFGNDGSGGAFPRASPLTSPGDGIAATRLMGDQTRYFSSLGDPALNPQPELMPPTMRPFGVLAPGNITIRVCQPLSCISGIWDTDQLSPSFLMAGARLDLTLQNKEQVFQVRATDGTVIVPSTYSYVISNPKMVLETITFTDAVLRSVSMTSANVGLEIPFIAMHSTTAAINNSDVSIQINRGLSRANMIIARIYPNTTKTNTGRTAELDSNAAYFVAPTTQGWQVKLGAEFMPAMPITDPLALYHATQTAFGNWKADRRNTVRMIDYMGADDYAVSKGVDPGVAYTRQFCPYATLGVFGMTLEKSSTLAQSGSPISAARDLNVVFGGNDFVGLNNVVWGGLSVDVFVPYVTLATVFLDSVLTRS